MGRSNKAHGAKKKAVILGVRDAQGNKIDLSKPKERQILALHYHPDVISKNFHDFLQQYKDMQAPKEVIDLFTDATLLIDWAKLKLPVIPPPTHKEDESKECDLQEVSDVQANDGVRPEEEQNA